MKRKILRWIRYPLETIFIYTLFGVFMILPINVSSTIGGLIAQGIGKLLKKRNKIAMINLSIAFPEKSEIEKKIIISKMWNHMGRIFGEMPHWYRMNSEKIFRHIAIPKNLNFPDKIIALSGHYGNWELFNHLLPTLGMKCGLIYRSLDNKFLDVLLKKTRIRDGAILLKKNAGAIKNAIKLFRSGVTLGMLIDQRYNDGANIIFFSKETTTLTLPARLAIQDETPIFMLRIMREKGANYVFEAIELPTKNYLETMQNAQAILESWIREKPEQWLWIHKRWSQENYQENLFF